MMERRANLTTFMRGRRKSISANVTLTAFHVPKNQVNNRCVDKMDASIRVLPGRTKKIYTLPQCIKTKKTQKSC